jgi:carbonic anhydrase/acetyltransferase-like protein (isoleucine patch superfamily)
MPTAFTLPYEGTAPHFATPAAFAGEGAAVLGRVTVGRKAWLGGLSVIRADGHVVMVGDDFHLGRRSTLHIAHEVYPCLVGDRVAVGENSCVHACTVGSDVVIGDNCVILDGATVADNVIFEDNSIVFPGRTIEGGFLYAGVPAKPVRPLNPGELAERRAALIARHARGDHSIAPRRRPAANSELHESVFIAGTATVRGRIVAEEGSSVFFSNELDAGEAAIHIGRKTNIQDNTIIRCTGAGFRIGHDSTIGHNVLLHDCAIGNHSLIGIGSTVAQDTVVGDHVLLAAGAATEPGQVLESGFLYAGTPAVKRVPLDKAKQDMIAFTIWTYSHYSQVFKAAQREPVS